MHTHGVQRPGGLKLRVMKTSGRTLEDTTFHMEIRTPWPGQVWSVCRRHQDFLKLHACLQPRFPPLALPRLPRLPSGAGVLDPATLERTRAGLRSYAAAIVVDGPFIWGLEDFEMFLDSGEEGGRLFGYTRKKETRMVAVRPPAPEEQGSKSSRETLLDLNVKEKKKVMAELEGEPQNHLEGVGVIIPNEISLSDDDDDLTTGTPHSRTNHYTKHTHGVQRPKGLKLRVVKTSGRNLEETTLHMEIRTPWPG
ncbi:unnamed protein product [Ascophyllum nodosum]